MRDALPLVLAFISTLLGVGGATWDEKRKGLKRVTGKGWFVIALAALSLLLGNLTLRAKNREIADASQVRQIACQEIADGLGRMLHHLAYYAEPSLMRSNRDIFRLLRDPAYLERIGRLELVEYLDTGLAYNGSGPSAPEFRDQYEAIDYDISFGDHIIDEAIVKYGHLLSADTILKVNAVRRDPFFARLGFAHARAYLDEGRLESQSEISPSPWIRLGLYYFNAVYDGPSRRKPDYSAYLRFLAKVEALLANLNRGRQNEIVLFPGGSVAS